MIIRELYLKPFAGVSDRLVSFEEGLNVVLGPNEAGKSTIVNAIRFVLFTRTKYTKPEFKKGIKGFLPLTGGDTIQVGINFDSNDEHYKLEKSWGGSTFSEMILPEGGLLSDEETVNDRLVELLVLNEGVYQSTLIAYQAGLANTLKELEENSDTPADLISILRKAVYETDGVSVEKLGDLIEKKHKELFEHWDIESDQPENGRGIENPYKRGVGRILKTYYEKEELKRDLADAISHENRIDELNAEIRTAQKKNAKLSTYVEKNSKIARDAAIRLRLEGKRKSLQVDQRGYRSTLRKWPEIINQIEANQKKKEKSIKLEGKLKVELDNTEQYEKSKDLIRVFGTAKKKLNSLELERRKLDGMKVIEEKDFSELEYLYHEIERLITSLEAGKLSISFEAKKALSLNITEDFKDEAKHRFKAESSLQITAGGRVGIRHDDWELLVTSGEVSMDELEEKIVQCKEDFQKNLDKLSVSSFEEAKDGYKAYSKQVEKVSNLEEQYEDSLEGQDYDELVKLSKKSPEKEPERSLAVVSKQLGKVESELAQIDEKNDELLGQIEEWEDDYETIETLKELVSTTATRISELGNKLKELEPLPDDVVDVDAFMDEFEKKNEELKEIEEKIHEYRIEIAGLEGGALDVTSEVIAVVLKDAESQFINTMKEGDALRRIKEGYERIRATMDEKTFDPWIAHLEEIVAPLTGDRYRGTDIIEGDTTIAIRNDDVEVPFDALSMGTKVGLGLALRLAMSKYFLEGLNGFLVIDDPLIELDPDRQTAAVKVIRGFAKEKQTIVMTCHPDHADMLGGNRITLKRLPN